jgi:hypothetical protein
MQVPIMATLLSQLTNNVIMIPEMIVLHLGLLKAAESSEPSSVDEGNNSYKKLGRIVEVSRESLRGYLANCGRVDQMIFPKLVLTVLPQHMKNDNFLAVFTEIKIYGGEDLKINESGLTTPLILQNISSFKANKLTVSIRYEVSPIPGVKYQIHPC